MLDGSEGSVSPWAVRNVTMYSYAPVGFPAVAEAVTTGASGSPGAGIETSTVVVKYTGSIPLPGSYATSEPCGTNVPSSPENMTTPAERVPSIIGKPYWSP